MGGGSKRAKAAKAAKRAKVAKAARKPPQVQTATDKTFKGRALNGLVLVDFWAPWCTPCLSMTPVLARLAALTPDLKVVQVDITRGADKLMTEYSIRSIPFFIIFRDGKIVADVTGTRTLAQLQVLVADARVAEASNG